MTKPIPTNNFEKDSSGKASRINEDNSRTPLVELQEDPSNPFDVEIKNTNTETSKSDETWYEVPQTAKGEETGEGVVTALAKTQLAGGVDPIVPKLFITVI